MTNESARRVSSSGVCGATTGARTALRSICCMLCLQGFLPGHHRRHVLFACAATPYLPRIMPLRRRTVNAGGFRRAREEERTPASPRPPNHRPQRHLCGQGGAGSSVCDTLLRRQAPRKQDCCQYEREGIGLMALEIGMRGEATLLVGEEHTAEAF